MNKWVLGLLLLCLGCGGAAESTDFGDFITEDYNEVEVKVIEVPPGSEIIDYPNSVMSHYSIGLDPSWENSEPFYFAVNSINSVFGREVLIVTDYYDAEIEVDVEELTSINLAQSQPFKGPSCKVVLEPSSAEQWKLIAHELLHCMGFGHSDLRESLLYYRASQGDFTNEMVLVWEAALEGN